jgi:hypothetical protein
MFLKKILPFLISFLAITGLVSAQVTTSNISGTVKADNGSGLANASVKVTNAATGAIKSVQTDKNGRFFVPNLDPGGPYTVAVTFVGQAIQDKTDIYLTLGNTEVLDFVGKNTSGTLTTVLVSGNVAGTRTVKTGTTSNFNARIINTVPNISRSITNVATLTPQAGGGNSFGGRDGRYNNVQIDGANFNNNFGLRSDPLPGGSSQSISLDAIDEINVAVSPFDVRQANFTGAGLSATTRRGTNTFTGSVFGFTRNEGLIGRKALEQDVVVTPSTAQSGGFRIGGPIIKNKLFFFANAEIEQRSIPGIFWKPTRAGVTPDANTSRATADSLQKFSDHLRNAYGYNTGGFDNFDNFEVNNWKAFARIDWAISQQHNLSLRYNRYKNVDDQQLNGTSNAFPGALPNNRFGVNAMSFQNSNYGFENNLELFAAELKSNFNSKFSNNFIATYTKANDGRTSESSLFPFIEIMNAAPGATAVSTDNIMSAGYEPFTYKNNVENNTLNITNNFTYNAGKHTVTAGVGYEKIYVNNSFFRFGTSYYRFNSLFDFMNNRTPTGFAYTYANNPAQEGVELDFAQASAYIQDEVKVNDRFKFTYGVRLDRPMFQNELVTNPAVDAFNFKDLNGNPLNFKSGSWPKERTYFSPRVGFNWDVDGDKKTIVRGGAGLFTGRFPFVWFTNQPSNSFTTVRQYATTVPTDLVNYPFSANPSQYDAAVRALPSTTAITTLVYVDEKFKMPQVFRLSGGVDQKLDDNWTLTLDAIYNKDVNALFMYNANQQAPVGTVGVGVDNRPLYGATTATRRFNSALNEAIVFTNTKKGFGLVFTAQIARRFANNWDFSVAYTNTATRDITNNPGATANSAWSGLPTLAGNNNPALAFSDFATPHRLLAYGSYKLKWSKYTSTTFSLVYTGFTQGTFSYTLGGDANSDGVSNNDLMYIPKDASEITFVTNGAFSPAQQSAAFFSYIEQDKYLRRKKGQYAERNGARLPFFSNIDLRILQDITPLNDKKKGVQLSLEIENFGNMVNSNWGVTRRTALSNARLLSVATAGTATAAPTYRLNLENGALPTKTFRSNITAGNVWRANLGVRLNF